MARGELVTIEFMGLDKGKDAVKEKCVHDLSWIKTKMMHQGLSSNKGINVMQALKGLFYHSVPNSRKAIRYWYCATHHFLQGGNERLRCFCREDLPITRKQSLQHFLQK